MVLTLYSIANWVTAAIFLFFAVVLRLGGRKPSARTYSLISVVLAIWSAGVAILVSNYGSESALFWSRFNHFVGSLVGPLFLYFTLLYPEEVKPHKSIALGLFFIELGLGYLYFYTDLIIKEASAILTTGIDLAWSFGEYWYIFPLTFAFPFLGGFLVLLEKAQKAIVPSEKQKIYYILGGTLLSAIFGMAVNVILPAYEIFTYSWLGPPLTISWVAITTYVIQKYSVLSVKVVASIALILALLLILFINIFA